MEEKKISKNEAKQTEMKEFIERGFEQYSNIMNSKMDELNDRLNDLENKVMGNIGSHITESAHDSYQNMCNEFFKMNNNLKKELKSSQKVIWGLLGFIILLLFILLGR